MKTTFQLAAVALGILGAFVAGTLYSRPATPVAQTATAKYYCPMHPQYTADYPGTAPCCGMRLEPIAAGGPHVAPEHSPGTVHVTTDKQELLGIRVATVAAASVLHKIRLSGRVSVDEGRLYRIASSGEFWIRRVYAPTTGSIVKAGEPLAAFYTNNYLTSAQTYLYALTVLDQHKENPASSSPEQMRVVNSQVRQAVESLRYLGVTDIQIDEIAQTRKVMDLVTVRSPADGVLLARNVSAGQWVTPGTEMYIVADLSRVWVLADVFEDEAEFVRPGMTALVTHPALRRSYGARVSDVPPVFEPASRTLKVRLEVDNRGYSLRPDMFVDVEFPVSMPRALRVPEESVLDSGLRKVVYVATGGGYFEPREVQTGVRFAGEVEIKHGIAEGDQIVVAGNFLIDSESRMQLALGLTRQPAAAGSEKDPICGMHIEPTRAAGKSEHQGKTYYFCSQLCKKKFDVNPEGFIGTKSAGQGRT